MTDVEFSTSPTTVLCPICGAPVGQWCVVTTRRDDPFVPPVVIRNYACPSRWRAANPRPLEEYRSRERARFR